MTFHDRTARATDVMLPNFDLEHILQLMQQRKVSAYRNVPAMGMDETASTTTWEEVSDAAERDEMKWDFGKIEE